MRFLRSAARKIKHAGRVLLGRDLWVHPDVRCPCEILGNLNAQFAINSELIRQDSTVYSFGIGTDISFDLELIRHFGVEVHAFDPTPRSLSWLQTQEIPTHFHFHDYGVDDSDGVIGFSPPASPEHVSHTIVSRKGSEPTVWAPVHRVTTIMKDLGHTSIDVLKMDIEGAEYGVICDLLRNAIEVRQLCVEFHHRWAEIGVSKTLEAISALRAHGYRLFHVSDSGEEYSFLGPHCTTLPLQNRSGPIEPHKWTEPLS